MSDWPPQPPQQPAPQQPTGQEWKLLEKAVLASVEEQRRARRWGIFFKILTFIYLLVVLLLMAKSCSSSGDEEAVSAATSAPHLAVIDIQGTISNSKDGVNSTDTNRALKKAFEAKGSKAVVLNINSPGGSPVQSDLIWQEIRYQKQKHPEKKVYAVIGDTGASGAYYIASAADEIYVNPSSLVGSIGVIMPNYDLEGLTQKLGVKDRTMTSGQYKDILSMTRPMTEQEKAHVQAMLQNVHQHFIDAVKTGRGKRLKNNPDLFSGLFWTGEQAIQLGLADKEGSIATLARETGIHKTVDYTIQRTPLDSLLGKMGSSIGQGIGQSISQQMDAQSQAKLQ